MKPCALEFLFLCQDCIKTQLHAFASQKIVPGGLASGPPETGRENRKREWKGKGKEKGRGLGEAETIGREREGGGREGKRGEGSQYNLTKRPHAPIILKIFRGYTPRAPLNKWRGREREGRDRSRGEKGMVRLGRKEWEKEDGEGMSKRNSGWKGRNGKNSFCSFPLANSWIRYCPTTRIGASAAQVTVLHGWPFPFNTTVAQVSNSCLRDITAICFSSRPAFANYTRSFITRKLRDGFKLRLFQCSMKI